MKELDCFRTTFENGLNLILVKRPFSNTVALRIYVKVGSRDETSGYSGISHFLEHLLSGQQFERSPQSILSEFESFGAMFTSRTAKEYTYYGLETTEQWYGKGMTLLAELLRNSRFDSAIIDKEKDVVLKEIQMYKDSQQVMWDAVDRLQWRQHPLGNSVLGLSETVADLDRGVVTRHYEDYYQPYGMVVCVAGDISERETIDIVQSQMGDMKKSDVLRRKLDGSPLPERREVFLEKDIHLTHLIISMLGAALTSPDRPILEIINILLGHGASCRLAYLLREKYSLAYQIASSIYAYEDTGQLCVHVSTDRFKVLEVKKLVMEELERLKREEIEERELARARAFYKQALATTLETNMGIVSMLGKEALISKSEPVGVRFSMIDSITSADIQQVATQYLDATNSVVLTMGPK